MKQYHLTNSVLKDLPAKNLVKEPPQKNIPHVIRLLILVENFAGKEGLIFYLSQVNEHAYKQKEKIDDWKSFENLLNKDSKYV